MEPASTSNGHATPEASEKLLAIRERLMRDPAYHESVRRGLDDEAAGRTMSAEELFRRLGW